MAKFKIGDRVRIKFDRDKLEQVWLGLDLLALIEKTEGTIWEIGEAHDYNKFPRDVGGLPCWLLVHPKCKSPWEHQRYGFLIPESLISSYKKRKFV